MIVSTTGMVDTKGRLLSDRTSCRPLSICYGFDRLSAKVASVLILDPFSGHLFLCTTAARLSIPLQKSTGRVAMEIRSGPPGRITPAPSGPGAPWPTACIDRR
jgi:hypothetical protein